QLQWILFGIIKIDDDQLGHFSCPMIDGLVDVGLKDGNQSLLPDDISPQRQGIAPVAQNKDFGYVLSIERVIYWGSVLARPVFNRCLVIIHVDSPEVSLVQSYTIVMKMTFCCQGELSISYDTTGHKGNTPNINLEKFLIIKGVHQAVWACFRSKLL